jgi:hypothetical protein
MYESGKNSRLLVTRVLTKHNVTTEDTEFAANKKIALNGRDVYIRRMYCKIYGSSEEVQVESHLVRYDGLNYKDVSGFAVNSKYSPESNEFYESYRNNPYFRVKELNFNYRGKPNQSNFLNTQSIYILFVVEYETIVN